VLLPDDSDEEMEARHAARTTLGRLGSPADVVEAVAYLIEADYVTGEQLVVDGGHSL
jgi:NAD(P)-dependent dehydrogenase (short-subunit alcohol dehydrogenase family)